MADKEFVCGYKFCLHHGEKVKASESVVINKKHYHWDCADMKQQVKECVDEYMNSQEDMSLYPMATRIINNLVFKDEIPVEFILKNVRSSRHYYSTKPVQILYGIRKLFWEKEFRA